MKYFAAVYPSEGRMLFTAKSRSGKKDKEVEYEITKVQEILKIAEARLNGIFGCICIFDFGDAKNISADWAKECGFKKIEFIDKKKAKYVDAIAQLPFKMQRSDLICIKNNYGTYEIWQRHIYQIDLNVHNIMLRQSLQNHRPNFVLYPISDNVAAELRKELPDCQFFEYKINCDSQDASLKYAKIMADKEYDAEVVSECVEQKDATTPFTERLQSKKETKSESLKSKKIDEDLHKKTTKSDSLASIEESKAESSKFKKTLTNQDFRDRLNFTFPNQILINPNQPKVIGIDLGTSRCCVAVNRKNTISTVHLDNKGERLLPSYVAYDEEKPICGQVVVNKLGQFSKSTVFDSKRIIGRNINEIDIDANWPFRISHENDKVIINVKKGDVMLQKSAEDVAADLLKYMKEKAEQFQGCKLYDVVITVPAAFSDSQKESTNNAAKLAGWKRICLLPEPVAAAFAYFTDQTIPQNSNVLVFDLGGGTLDVCVFKISNNEIRIVSNTGDTKLGGRDFDTVLFNFFYNKLDGIHGITLNKNKKYKLIFACQGIKEDLSSITKCYLSLDDFEPNKDGSISVTRQEFEDMTKPLQNRIRNTLNAAMHVSKHKPKEIDKILLVGGGSRMPVIKEILLEMFPEAQQCIHENPDEIVAIGAAHYALNLFSNNTEPELQL